MTQQILQTMGLQIIEIGKFIASFKNDEIESQNQGLIRWSDLEPITAGAYKTIVSGTDVSGGFIPPIEVEVEIEGEVNPTKVFWAIAKALKTALCPDCKKWGN